MIDGHEKDPEVVAQEAAAKAQRDAEAAEAARKAFEEEEKRLDAEEEKANRNPVFEKVPYPPLDRFVEPVPQGAAAWWEEVETDGG